MLTPARGLFCALTQRTTAWRSTCFDLRMLSISPWMPGTWARSPTCRCDAAGLRLGGLDGAVGGLDGAVDWQVCWHRRVRWLDGVGRGLNDDQACIRSVAQMMFSMTGGSVHHPYSAPSRFNQDLNAWDVRQVTDMAVRCCPRRDLLGPWVGGLALGSSTHLACVAWRAFRVCSMAQCLSISPWLPGTLARSLTWRCAAAQGRQGRYCGGRVSPAGSCSRS